MAGSSPVRSTGKNISAVLALLFFQRTVSKQPALLASGREKLFVICESASGADEQIEKVYCSCKERVLYSKDFSMRDGRSLIVL